MLDVLCDGRIAQLGKVIGTPVPLHSGNEETVESALCHGKRSRMDSVEQRRSHTAHGPGRFLGFFSGPEAAPDDGTHRLQVKGLRKHRGGRNHEEGEESVHLLRSRQYEFTIRLQNIPSLLRWPKCRAELNGAYRMQAELERGYNPEITHAASDSPKTGPGSRLHLQ